MGPDPYTAPDAPLVASPPQQLAGVAAAALAALAAALLMLRLSFAPRTALVYSPQCLLALGMVAIGLWRFARGQRGQAACYGLAAVSFATLFGVFRGGLLELCVLLCGLAAMAAARSATALPRPEPATGLPVVVAGLFGASAWGLASLSIYLTPVEASLAALLGRPEYSMPELLVPIWGFSAAAIMALCTAGMWRGRWRWHWLAFVLGGAAYDAAVAAQADYLLPGAYGPYQIDILLCHATPFALGAGAALGWRYWRTRVALPD